MTEPTPLPNMNRKDGDKSISGNSGNILNFEERFGLILGTLAIVVSVATVIYVMGKLDTLNYRLDDYKDRTITAETEVRVMQDFFSDHHIVKNPITKRYEFVKGAPNDEQTQR
jgi:hypothetical protein